MMAQIVPYETYNLKADFLTTTEQGDKVNGGAIASYNTKKMKVDIFAGDGGGKRLAFDLGKANERLAQFKSFFSSRVEVEIGPEGAGKLRVIDGNGEIAPTSALRKVVRHLALQGVRTLSYDFPDRINSLEAFGDLPPGTAMPLSVWKQQLPTSASLLRAIDDGK